MKFFKIARKIRTEEDGAVTVDWVVLTAAIVALGAIVMTSISTSTQGLATKIGTYLSGQEVNGGTSGGGSGSTNP
jgi:Flp pilus assembly pilin Flp